MEPVTTFGNQTSASYASSEGGSKAWHYLVGVLVTAICLSALTIICAKFRLFHKYFTSYSHHLLPEVATQDIDRISVSMAYDGNMKEDRNQAMYPSEGLEEEDGYIEDNYIQTGAKAEDDEEIHITI